MKTLKQNLKRLLECLIVFRHLLFFMSVIPVLDILHIAEKSASSKELLEMLIFFRYVFWGYWIAEVFLVLSLKQLKSLSRSDCIKDYYK